MKHIVFICLLFFCIACEENKSVDPTLMPEATATGANTFGCLVDGWVSVSGRWGLPVAEFTQLEDSTGMTISAQKSTLPGCLTGYSAGLLRETVLQKDAST